MISRYFSSSDLQALLALGPSVPYKKGAIVLGADQERNNVYIVESGLVAIYGRSARKDGFVHIMYGPGELFPISAVTEVELSINNGSRVIAELDSCIRVIPRKLFEEFLDANPTRLRSVLRQVVDQMIMYTYRVENLQCVRASERVVYRILLMASRFGIWRDEDVLEIPKISRHTVAGAINLSEEVVSREMSRLKGLGIISYAPGVVRIHDVEALCAQLNSDVNPPFVAELHNLKRTT